MGSFQILILLALILLVKSQESITVDAKVGKITGFINNSGIRTFKGIPYAKPPVGDLRWEYPIAKEPFQDTYIANYDAPGCQQLCKLPPGNCPLTLSEDCLYLTVMTPNEPSPDPGGYPVFFWMHGGAYEQGLGNCALYDGTNFVKNNVITVVINYRLGALGFLAGSNMQGNYGTMDQRLAMKWTQDNIAAFGGNPNAVTIAGQSAGAMSVVSHLQSPNATGLYRYAIIESDPLSLPFHTKASAAKNAESFSTYLKCDNNDLACLRSKTPEEILEAQEKSVKINLDNMLENFLPFSPLVDGVEILEQPLDALRNGHFNNVPILAGSLLQEGILFVNELFSSSLSKLKYDGVIKGTFGNKNENAILELYPSPDYVGANSDGRPQLSTLTTDLLFYCPLRNAVRGYQSALGNNAPPTFVYQFTHVLSFDCWGPDYTFCVGAVCHGSELPFVFNTFTDGTTVYYPTPDERQLQIDISNAWINFIKNGNPNKGLPVPSIFPQYSGSSDTIVIMNEPGFQDTSNLRDTYCDLWDRLGYSY